MVASAVMGAAAFGVYRGCLQHLWQSDQHWDFCSGGSGGLFCPSDPVEGCGRLGTEKYAWQDQTVRIGKKTASDEDRSYGTVTNKFKVNQISRYYAHKEENL